MIQYAKSAGLGKHSGWPCSALNPTVVSTRTRLVLTIFIEKSTYSIPQQTAVEPSRFCMGAVVLVIVNSGESAGDSDNQWTSLFVQSK
jgi:hypothetical protein